MKLTKNNVMVFLQDWEEHHTLSPQVLNICLGRDNHE